MKRTSFIIVCSLSAIAVIAMLTNGCKKDSSISTPETGSCTDFEGNIYETVKIGTQWWMAENLRSTRLNDGTNIPLVTDSASWVSLSTPGSCFYNNDTASYKDTYGAMYNWHAVNTGKLCPKGWHVPADNEWHTLISFLGSGSVAGGKMKETGTSHWLIPNEGASNQSRFTALPGGFRGYNDYGYSSQGYTALGYRGYWWTATEYAPGDSSAYVRCLDYKFPSVLHWSIYKTEGICVRCIMD